MRLQLVNKFNDAIWTQIDQIAEAVPDSADSTSAPLAQD
jgi:hypothetical protein